MEFVGDGVDLCWKTNRLLAHLVANFPQLVELHQPLKARHSGNSKQNKYKENHMWCIIIKLLKAKKKKKNLNAARGKKTLHTRD